MKANKLQFILVACFLLYVTISFAKTKEDFHAWASTPPMGWNSWDCFGPTVTESELKANADYMAKELKSFGWNYIICDIRWYVSNDKAHGYNDKDPDYVLDEFGRFQPAINRFPSSAGGKGFKPIADYMHKKGLKFGIHIMRGVPVVAVRRKMPIKGTNLTVADIYSENDQCRWLKDMYTVLPDKPGAQEYYNSLFELYASWGIDFVKIDDLSSPIYFEHEIDMIRKAIDHTGRKIVLSTSPGETPVAYADHVQKNANMWRTVGDFWDSWSQLKEHFEVFDRWNQWRAYGAYPDGDMLPLGHIGLRAERGDPRMSKFTKDEQYTLMTLFSIFKSPLMFGGNLPDNDPFALSLLTNKNVLKVLNESTNNKPLFRDQQKVAWVADEPNTGAKYLAVFNIVDQKALSEDKAIWDSQSSSMKIPVNLNDLGFPSTCIITDLWSGLKMGEYIKEFAPEINRHGAGLYKIERAKYGANPALDGLFADPEVLYSEKTGKFYIYPTSDGFNNWSGNYFKAFSSKNLVDWKDEGVILDLPKNVSWANQNAWAPCIIEKKRNGIYTYFYYFVAAHKIGVAVADNPTGPFSDSGKPLIENRPEGINRGQQIDPDVFMDPKTGKNYLYWGNAYMAGAELNDDMVSIKPETQKVLVYPNPDYSEGSYVFYRKGIYYFTWSQNDTRSEDYCVRYGTSDTPLGKIKTTENNYVIRKDTTARIYGTGHHSILQIPGKDEWYIVYHRFNYPNGIKMGRLAGYNREVCIDKLEFNADGTIKQVIPTHRGIKAVKL